MTVGTLWQCGFTCKGHCTRTGVRECRASIMLVVRSKVDDERHDGGFSRECSLTRTGATIDMLGDGVFARATPYLGLSQSTFPRFYQT